MTLAEIITMFRTENTDIPSRVVSNALLKDWAKTGDKEICAISRCIPGEFTITSIASSTVYTARHDLVAEHAKFYDIDDYPGGGVSFDDEPLDKTSMSELDHDDNSWRSRSAGEPKKYYRRGNYLYFDRPVSSSYAGKTIRIYCSEISIDLTEDSQLPYNELSYLEPFHAGIVRYLTWRAKGKVGKKVAADTAGDAFMKYALWMKKEIGGGKFSPIHYHPKASGYRRDTIRG